MGSCWRSLFFLLIWIVIVNSSITARQTQYRRGTELQAGCQTYEQKYQGKDLNEEKRRLFPLESTGVWTELNPKVPRVDYLGIHFVNTDKGWACGDLGALIKTTDGGDNWTISGVQSTSLLLKVHSYNGQVVIATGYDGLILRSTDGGENFVQITSGVGTGIDLWGVQMLNDTLGWVCGLYQTLLKTTDAGQTWEQIYPGLNQHYWSLDFLNEQYGMIACGGGKVLKTTDGGNNWTEIQAGDTRALYTIDIIDSLHIAAAGQWGNEIQYEGGKNVYSSNRGETWIQNPDIPTYTDANWIEFLDADTGYAMMVDKGIYKTTNRGQSWFSVGGGGEWQLDLTEDGTGYSGGEGLNIYKRTDGLENWSKIFLNINWNNVFFVSEIKGYFIGNVTAEGFYITEDGGMSFQKIENSPGGNVLTFVNANVGFIGGRSYTRIYKTLDTGNTWNLVNISGLTDTVGRINKIFFINPITGWAVANGILKTTDNGFNWFTQFNAPFAGLTSIFFVDSLYGWATDVGNRPYKTTDGGLNWIEQTNLNIWDSDDIFFRDYLNGCLIGFNILYNTTNGGTSWVINSDITGFGIAKFSTFQDSTIFILGGKTYRSLDGGENWYEFAELDGISLKGMSLVNSGLGFAVANEGLIMKYFDTTYVPVELNSFSASVTGQNVLLTWATATETNNRGFEVQKSQKPAFGEVSLKSGSKVKSQKWQGIGFVKGNGTTTERHSYRFTDNNVNPGIYKYRLKQIDLAGSFEYSKEIEVDITGPQEFSLEQNYPNPFNPTTTISYELPVKTYITLKVYNTLGEEVAILVNEEKAAGRYEVTFDGSNLPSGVYIYRLTAGSYTAAKKLVLLK